VERVRLEAALRQVAPQVWEITGDVADRIPAHTRTLIDRAVWREYEAVLELLNPGELATDTVDELEALGFSLSRMLAWDVIDELNKAYVETVVNAIVECAVASAGDAARAAVTVSDALYDGFWVYNNHEGFEQALRLGALIDHFPSPTFMLDEFGSVTFANSECCRTAGMSLSEVDGRKLEDLVTADGPLLVEAESHVTVAAIDGLTRYFVLSVNRIDTSKGTEFIGQLIERTEAVMLERTKEQVIATISHELRTPLTAVVGYAELLQAADGLDESDTAIDRDEAMNVIYEQARHLLELVTDLVDFARLDTGRIVLKESEVDLRSVIELVGRRVGGLDEVQLFLRIPHRTLPWADRTRIEQLLTNLLTNAVRYGGPNVTIDAWAPSKKSIFIRVCDGGTGIAAADRVHVFESFYQGDRSHVGVGTGMGLAICKGIVRAHGGSIVLEDRPGTSFLIELTAAT
jgi:signal transduction histidine kinase